MQFVLRGFTQTATGRVFAFEGVAADYSRSPYTVSVDLAASRRHGISLQELPALCRDVLTAQHELGGTPTDSELTYTEDAMRRYAESLAERAAQKKRTLRRPVPSRTGSAWRTAPRAF